MQSARKNAEPAEGRDYPFFSEGKSADVVNARIDRSISDPRLATIMESLTRHLHAFIKEVEPSLDEWLQGIEFLTATGHTCTEWRQEFILLSDVLGVSMLVDSINNRRPTGATESTILGPFYVKSTPNRANGESICLDGKGEPLLVRGHVRDSCGNAIPGAVIDIWQTNDDGFYDVQQKGIQPDMNMRGTFKADEDGAYWFRSVKPRYYPIPEDGPVGKLLKALGRHPNRPAHIHAIVTADGFDPVITHIFDPNCAYLREDAVFGVKESLIGDFREVADPARARTMGFAEDKFWEIEADFMLVPATGKAAFVHQV